MSVTHRATIERSGRLFWLIQITPVVSVGEYRDPWAWQRQAEVIGTRRRAIRIARKWRTRADNHSRRLDAWQSQKQIIE